MDDVCLFMNIDVCEVMDNNFINDIEPWLLAAITSSFIPTHILYSLALAS